MSSGTDDAVDASVDDGATLTRRRGFTCDDCGRSTSSVTLDARDYVEVVFSNGSTLRRERYRCAACADKERARREQERARRPW